MSRHRDWEQSQAILFPGGAEEERGEIMVLQTAELWNLQHPGRSCSPGGEKPLPKILQGRNWEEILTLLSPPTL
jgi:hypothetical protein